ncbi:ABC transporter permease [Allobacillus halotolerans]|uniref:ABC transporter permease n=1 Tax=Allobacillus halotolerans TaxID=570278 RepID=A0ABS6GU81_9BACI|nr:ABC transporter permease [Allobacillus halotolerans]MBU6081980.1 ABC transporter permease [Allobacillus halotolerans]
MLKFIVRRLLQLVPVLIGVTFLVFIMLHITPGDPAEVLAGEGATVETIENINERLGLNEPLHQQYLSFLSNAVQFDFGTSWRTGREVSSEIAPRFFVTLELAIYSTILSVFLGVIAGVISAVRRYSLTDVTIMLVALFGLSMPNFWLGLMLMQWFAVKLDWLPATGWGSGSQVILPVIALGTAGAAIIARMTRSSMLEIISQDYIRTARAKGVTEKVVIYRHALRNAMIPVVTVVGLQFGYLLGGAVLTETVFAINGLGRLVVDRIASRDFPVIQASILVIASLFVFVNVLVDISYRILNKRIDLD